MTPDELRALADAASPGVWIAFEDEYGFHVENDLHEYTLGRGDTVYADCRLFALASSLARDHAALLKWAERAADVLRDPWETVWTVDEAEPERGEQPTIRRKDVSALLAEFDVLREGS